jgi:hypothetical protein
MNTKVVKIAETKKVELKPTTRKDLLALLDGHGYNGPRSYTATILSAVVEWLDAGASKDRSDGIPDGVLFAVHPDLRPTPAAKPTRRSKAYLAGRRDALVEASALMQGKGASVANLRTWLLEQVEALEVEAGA